MNCEPHRTSVRFSCLVLDMSLIGLASSIISRHLWDQLPKYLVCLQYRCISSIIHTLHEYYALNARRNFTRCFKKKSMHWSLLSLLECIFWLCWWVFLHSSGEGLRILALKFWPTLFHSLPNLNILFSKIIKYKIEK